MLLMDQPQIGGSHDTLARASHKAQRNTLLTRLQVYNKRTYLRNSQVEEMNRARSGERARSFHALFRGNTLPAPSTRPPTRKLSEPSFLLGFYGGLITKAQLVKSQIAGDSTSSFSAFSELRED